MTHKIMMMIKVVAMIRIMIKAPILTTVDLLMLRLASGVITMLFPSRTRAHAVPAMLSPPPRSLRPTTLSKPEISSHSLSSRLLTADTVAAMVAMVDGLPPSLTLLLLQITLSGLRQTTNTLVPLAIATLRLPPSES